MTAGLRRDPPPSRVAPLPCRLPSRGTLSPAAPAVGVREGGERSTFCRRGTKERRLALAPGGRDAPLTSLFKNTTARDRKRYSAFVKHKVLSITIITAIII